MQVVRKQRLAWNIVEKYSRTVQKKFAAEKVYSEMSDYLESIAGENKNMVMRNSKVKLKR